MRKRHHRPRRGGQRGRWKALPPPQLEDTVPPEFLNGDWSFISCRTQGRRRAQTAKPQVLVSSLPPSCR